MTEEDIKQVLTSPAVREYFNRILDDKRHLMSVLELSRRVGANRRDLSYAMDLWTSSKGAFGLAFMRLNNDGRRYTCMSAYDDWVRREQLSSAGRGEIAWRGAR